MCLPYSWFFACSDGVYLLRENHIFIYLPGWGHSPAVEGKLSLGGIAA